MIITRKDYLIASPGVRSKRAVKMWEKFKRDFEKEFTFVKERPEFELSLSHFNMMGNAVASWNDWKDYETADDALDDLPFIGPLSSWALQITVTKEV